MLALGGITAVMGVLYALMQHDLKRLLAYHTVENIGIIFIGLGLALAFKAHGMLFAAALALTAALLHVFNHSLFKSLLFFGAGAVLTATGERDMEHLGGLIHRMPQTAFVFLVGCAAISALPPLNGFVSEWLTFQAILLSPQLPSWGLKLLVPAVGALLALSAALAAACFVKAFGVTFLGRPRTRAAEAATETDRFSLAAMFLLAALCLLAGILPGLFIDALAPVSSALIGARMPVQIGAQWLSIVPIAASRSSYDGLLVFLFMVDIRHARGVRDPPPRLGPPAPRAGLGLRLSRCQPGDAIHRDELCPADPPRVRHRRVPRPRACRDAAARRHPAGAAHGGSSDLDLGLALRAARRRHRLRRRPAQPSAVPDHPAIPQPRVRRARHPAAGARHMALIRDFAIQGAQMLLVLLLAPLLTGFVRKVKARLLRRQGPPLIQPYRDLVRLMRKEVVLADSASWLFRVIPYLVFAATWVAASLVPTFRTGLLFSWSADLIAIIALLGSGALLPRARRARRRHQLRRHRLEPRGDDRLARRTGDDHDRVHAGADRRLDAALDHRRIHGLAGRSDLRVSLGLALIAPDHGGDRRERPHSRRQSGDASRADHGARGDGARIFRPASGADRAFRLAQAHALCLADRLPVRALGHRGRPAPRCRRSPSASPPMSASSPSAASCSRCSRRRSPRCACSACRNSSAWR